MGDLRARQRELGRQAIVDACAALVSERHHLDFSMKEVAERAGVSLRTVYNHFATREDMLDALGDVINEQTEALGQKQAADLETLDDFYEAIAVNMSIFDKLGGISEAFAQMPSAPVDDAHAVAIMLRHLASHRSWFWLTREYGLDTDKVARIVNWAAETLIDAAENGRTPGFAQGCEKNNGKDDT